MSKHISASLGLISMLAALACSSATSSDDADTEATLGSVESAQVVADAGVDAGNVNDAGVVVADAGVVVADAAP